MRYVLFVLTTLFALSAWAESSQKTSCAESDKVQAVMVVTQITRAPHQYREEAMFAAEYPTMAQCKIAEKAYNTEGRRWQAAKCVPKVTL